MGLLTRMAIGLALLCGTWGCQSFSGRVMTVGALDDRLQVTAVDGVDRYFFLHQPTKAPPPGGWPVIFSFHGFASLPEWQEPLTHLGALADREDFLLVVPEGRGREWQDSRTQAAGGDADVRFFDVLLRQIRANYAVDSRRIYALGMSNGGSFAMRLACERAALLAAVAVVAANLPEPLAHTCRQDAKTPLILFVGGADPIAPPAGGEVKGLFGGTWGRFLAADATLKFWAQQAGCDLGAARIRRDGGTPEAPAVVVESYRRGCEGNEVVRYRFPTGGHAWPGGPQYLPAFFIGEAPQVVDATQEIWSFLRTHLRMPPLL